MAKPGTGFGLALSALLGTVLLSHIAAQQLDAKNWGKNSPGINLELREGPRQKTAQGLLLLYEVVGRGFPSRIPYELWQWKAGQEPKKVMQGVSLDERGVMVCSGRPGFCKGDGPDDPVNIRTTAQPGESKRIAVVSPDVRLQALLRLCRFPFNTELSPAALLGGGRRKRCATTGTLQGALSKPVLLAYMGRLIGNISRIPISTVGTRPGQGWHASGVPRRRPFRVCDLVCTVGFRRTADCIGQLKGVSRCRLQRAVRRGFRPRG